MMNAQEHAETRKAAGYTHMLYFTREFTAGNLEGIQHDDRIPFTTEADATDWVFWINAKNAAGKLNYRVVSHRVVCL